MKFMNYFIIIIFILSVFLLNNSSYSLNTNDIVIIKIDEITEAKIGKFPIKRSYFGELTDRLKEQNVRLIVFKFFFISKSQIKSTQ